jgi:hypothetical protein
MNINITNLKRGKMRQQFTIAYCLLPVAYLLLTTVCSAAPFETTYAWDAAGTDGWTNGYVGVTLSNPGGNLEMSFRSQTVIPRNEMDFAGLRIEAGQVVTNLQFSFKNVTMPAGGVWLAFHSAGSGVMWMKTMHVSSVGDWADNSVPISFESGWAAGARTSDENFNIDRQSIDWIGVYVQRNGSISAQKYAFDNFVVSGYTGEPPVVPVDSDGDGMTDVWETDNGLDPNDPGDAILDRDGDGMSNFAEYLTGTDPDDPNSIFGIEVGSSNNVHSVKGFMIQWKSQPGRKYDVLRSGDLRAGFDVLEENVTNTPPKTVYYDGTSTNGESFFYKVRVRE